MAGDTKRQSIETRREIVNALLFFGGILYPIAVAVLFSYFLGSFAAENNIAGFIAVALFIKKAWLVPTITILLSTYGLYAWGNLFNWSFRAKRVGGEIAKTRMVLDD